MERVPGWRKLLLMVALGMMLPAAAHAKPRLAILNLVPRVSSIDPATDLPRGLPAEYRDISEFDIADTTLTQELIEEWARARILPAHKRGEKLSRLYDVQFLVAGKVHAIKQRKWVVSFVILHGPQALSGREKTVADPSDFYSILDENDPTLGPVIGDLAGVFGFRKSLAGKGRQKRVCEDALSGEEAKSALQGKTLVLLEQFYMRFREDGVWETSKEADDLNERGKWWMEGKRICESVPGVQKPACRCLIREKNGRYKFVWGGGAAQYFRFQ